MHFAIENNLEKAVKALINRADENISDLWRILEYEHDGETPLTLALKNGKDILARDIIREQYFIRKRSFPPDQKLMHHIQELSFYLSFYIEEYYNTFAFFKREIPKRLIDKKLLPKAKELNNMLANTENIDFRTNATQNKSNRCHIM